MIMNGITKNTVHQRPNDDERNLQYTPFHTTIHIGVTLEA